MKSFEFEFEFNFRVALDDSKIDITILKSSDSGYTSIPSPSHTPHSLYECTGFASVSLFFYNISSI